METTLGKTHTQSPFTPIYQKYGFSSGIESPKDEPKTEVVVEKVEEEKKEPALQKDK